MSGWTDEAIDLAKTRWLQGVSCSAIAKELAERGLFLTTRNAVIGKLTRLGLMGAGPQRRTRKGDYSVPVKRKSKSATAQPFRFGAAPEGLSKKPINRPLRVVPIEPARRDGQLIDVLKLERNDCRWPHGEGADVHFCAHPAEIGPYCEHHARLAYGDDAVDLILRRRAKAAA